jgi:hypothetical protein
LIDRPDLRLQTDIEQVGTTVRGLLLYRFRYNAGMKVCLDLGMF